MIPTFTAEAALRESHGVYRTCRAPLTASGPELVTALDFGAGPLTSTRLGGSMQTAGQNCFQFCAPHYRCDGNCPLENIPNYGRYRPKCCWREVCESICVPKPV